MNARKLGITEHLAASNRHIGTALGCTIVIILASGCAAHSTPGFLEFNEIEPVVQCRAGTNMLCTIKPGRAGWFNKQFSACECIDADELDFNEFDPDEFR